MKYVVFLNGTDWCKESWSAAKYKKDICLISNDLVDLNRGLKRLLFRVHFSKNIRKHTVLPGKSIWLRWIESLIPWPRTEEIIFIIYDRSRFANDGSILSGLRAVYPNGKMVYCFTNVARLSGANENGFLLQLHDFYDLIFAFDQMDARAYGFAYSPLVYDPDPIFCTQNEEIDVFYVGKAKDRLRTLHDVYQTLNANGIVCRFYIVDVAPEEMIESDGIVYNHPLSYGQVLEHISDSKCLLEILQSRSTGLTIKACEAVAFGKILLTNNAFIRETPAYRPDKTVLIESNWVSCLKSCLKRASQNDRDSNNYFSIENFLQRIDQEIG